MQIKGVFVCTGIAPNANGTLVAAFRPEWETAEPGVTTEEIHFPVAGSALEANRPYRFEVVPALHGPVDPDQPGDALPKAA